MSEQLHDLLHSQVVCIIATNGRDGYPNTATVAFSHTTDLGIIFSTDNSTRKAANIARDNRIAVTVTDAGKRITMQAECTVTTLSLDEFDKKYAEKHFQKLPFTRLFRDIPSMTFYIAKPVRMKLTDINQKPWHVTEIIR